METQALGRAELLRIAETVACTRALGECEIVVVDGGSTDGGRQPSRS